MGAIADSIIAYAQPLLDEAGDSPEKMKKALDLAQFCWNLAILPEDGREELLSNLQTSLQMGDAEFRDFRETVIFSMIRRHHEMFPNMRPRKSTEHSSGPLAPSVRPVQPIVSSHTRKYPGTARNAPCPCNSGRKYKKCCGA